LTSFVGFELASAGWSTSPVIVRPRTAIKHLASNRRKTDFVLQPRKRVQWGALDRCETAMNETTGDLLRKMYEGYAAFVGLDPTARYLHGTPLRPVVPLDTGVGEVFVLGAYPSARFALIDGIADVPVGDNMGPFENERWFDGARVREQPSARELRDFFLEPLALERSRCWISDLVKVFLFKEGHVDRYRRLGAEAPGGYARERFAELAERSLPWIERELEAARPKLLITLGAEVAGILRKVRSSSAQVDLLIPRVEPISIGRVVVSAVHCAHPGILMRPAPTNPWPERHRTAFIPAIRMFLHGQPRISPELP
jgi:uracil-DNA glycosylase